MKRQRRGIDHGSSAEVKKKYSYSLTSLWFFMAGYRVKFIFYLRISGKIYKERDLSYVTSKPKGLVVYRPLTL
jgi:hypothetical protein